MNEDSMSSSLLSAWRQRLAGLFGWGKGGARDLWGTFDWPQQVSVQDLMLMYLRNPLASRIIRAFPQATWRDPPVIRDEAGDSSEAVDQNGRKNDNYSPFVKSVEDFFEQWNVFSYLERLDRLSGIGQYGVMLLGFNDGQPLNTPLQPGSNRKLTYISVYAQTNATVSSWEGDTRNPRYGMPKTYNLRNGSLVGGQQVSGIAALNVHHSRCIHVSEFLDENEVFGTPRLLPVYNPLLDLMKVLGSSSETFWLNARGGMQLKADADTEISPQALADMKVQAEEFENQLRRILALRGVEASMLTTPIADPKGNVDVLISTIAGGSAIPQRILIGSEMGQLASGQDADNWNTRVDERQKSFASPFILKPFVDLMISTGNIITPMGQWWPVWNDSAAMTPQLQAEVALNKARAIMFYTSAAGAEMVVPIEEFRQTILDLPPTSEYTEEEEPLDENDPEVTGAMPSALDAGKGGVQDTALNGTQIASLQAIVMAVGTGDLDGDSAIQLILVSFPTVDEDLAHAMIDPMVAAFNDAEAEKAKNPPPQLALPAPKPGDPVPPPVPDEAVVQTQTIRIARMLGRHIKTNAQPRSMYVYRPLLNAEKVRAHYIAQGFDKMVPAAEMHVTLAYSRKHVDWMKAGSDFGGGNDEKGRMTVPPGGVRINELLGLKRDVLTLLFTSSSLSWRHEDILRNTDASWDWPSFEPHITLTYEWDTADSLDNVTPYTGELVFGPEVFEEINEDYKDTLVENRVA